MSFLINDEASAGLLTLTLYFSWWQGLIVAVVGSGTRVLYRRQVEQARREENASTATVVWQGKSWDTAMITMRIRTSDPTGQEGSS